VFERFTKHIRKEPAGVHDHPDDGLPHGRQGRSALHQRISNANIFEAEVSRDAAQNRLIDDLLSLFGGRSKPVMARLVENG